MRFVRTVLIPDGACLHPIDRRFAEEPTVRREFLHNVNLLSDGTVTVLYQLSGDVERARTIVDESPEIIDVQLSASRSHSTVTAYAHIEPVAGLTELLELLDRHPVIVDTPMEYTARGGLRVVVVGREGDIRSAAAAVPDGLRLKLEELGDYQPECERLFGSLTPRQKETLMAALDVGYYEVPREATHEDVAERLDRSDGTVGEHLRKIERDVFTAITPR